LSRARNAEDFLQEYRQIRFQYDGLYRHRIEAIRASYSDNPSGNVPPLVDNALEAHLREYFVNAFLRALNWRMDASVEAGLPNLVPEAPVVSSLEGTTKFLDYLGTENEETAPLLIVESKRPRSPLPRRKSPTGRASIAAMADEPLASVIAAGLGGANLTGKWNEWIETLRDYVQSVFDRRDRAPRRVLLISGTWLVIFADPAASTDLKSALGRSAQVFEEASTLTAFHSSDLRAHKESLPRLLLIQWTTADGSNLHVDLSAGKIKRQGQHLTLLSAVSLINRHKGHNERHARFT
jgi:hypothetical protein